MKGIIVFISLLIGLIDLTRSQESADGSVCFNKCNGHGTCVDYSCQCFLGWSGDDCSTSFVQPGDEIIPIMGAGHLNLTSENFQSTISKNKLVVVGFSSYNCHKCIAAEQEYKNVSAQLLDKKILFARADADKMKSICFKYQVTKLPALVIFYKNKPYYFKGAHSAFAIVEYIDKLAMPTPFKLLASVQQVEAFLSTAREKSLHINTVNVIAFFSDVNSLEEDEYEEYKDVARSLQTSEDVFCGVVTNAKISKHFQSEKLIERTPSLLLSGEGGRHYINMNELDHDMGVQQWIETKAVPLVGHLDGKNFLLYEKIGLPMLMMFLDLRDADSSTEPGVVIGGRSGNILNEILLQEFRATAKEHIGRISFVYLDGVTHADQMKSLGLLGGIERLPSLVLHLPPFTSLRLPLCVGI